MSPRTGRPKSKNSKTTQIVVRMDEKDVKKLDECVKETKETRTETMRIAIRKLYEGIKK